jgi:hypothetical protein
MVNAPLVQTMNQINIGENVPFMSSQPPDSLNHLNLIGAGKNQGGSIKRPTSRKPEEEMPEQIEEAEQDAADPTHEKEVPPENQK